MTVERDNLTSTFNFTSPILVQCGPTSFCLSGTVAGIGIHADEEIALLQIESCNVKDSLLLLRADFI